MAHKAENSDYLDLYRKKKYVHFCHKVMAIMCLPLRTAYTLHSLKLCLIPPMVFFIILKSLKLRADRWVGSSYYNIVSNGPPSLDPHSGQSAC